MSQTETALAASQHPILLDTPAQLARAHEAWRNSTILGVDTEFVRERTYWARPGLFQISDGRTAWLLDPLAIGDLKPLIELFADPHITKIFHSPSEDLEVVWHSLKVAPRNVVDTQLACAMLGQGLQLGYHMAVQWLLDLEVAKDQTRSNWLHRPLSPAQLRYAALDVVLLPLMWTKLAARLEAVDRRGWLQEEMDRLLKSVPEAVDPERSYVRIKGANNLSPEHLPVLKRLAAWREIKAQEHDIPRGFVVRDNHLIHLAVQQPHSVEALNNLDGMHPSSVRKYGDTLIALSRSGDDSGNHADLAGPLADVSRRLLNSMRQFCNETADKLEVDPALLASKKELENLLRRLDAGGRPPARFMGWRYDVITRSLLEMYGPLLAERSPTG